MLCAFIDHTDMIYIKAWPYLNGHLYCTHKIQCSNELNLQVLLWKLWLQQLHCGAIKEPEAYKIQTGLHECAKHGSHVAKLSLFLFVHHFLLKSFDWLVHFSIRICGNSPIWKSAYLSFLQIHPSKVKQN